MTEKDQDTGDKAKKVEPEIKFTHVCRNQKFCGKEFVAPQGARACPFCGQGIKEIHNS